MEAIQTKACYGASRLSSLRHYFMEPTAPVGGSTAEAPLLRRVLLVAAAPTDVSQERRASPPLTCEGRRDF
jgi:hypothetical protein